jgi:glycine dehydrogenase subunit 1
VVHSIVESQNIEIVEVGYDHATGIMATEAFAEHADEAIAGVVIQHPNFFGNMEQVDSITDWAHEHKALLIAVTNPLSLTMMKPVSEWGETGADIAVGDGQPLGIPMASGGPHYGFMACTQAIVRQMPGRIIGKTIDLDGNTGYTLTLQAREQHIRRAKATSNICTNQGLAVTASTIHMALLGSEGLSRVATACIKNTNTLVNALTSIEGVDVKFTGPRFHEAVITLPVPDASVIVDKMTDRQILPGFFLGDHYPELANAILVCATEMRTEDDINSYVDNLKAVLAELGEA